MLTNINRHLRKWVFTIHLGLSDRGVHTACREQGCYGKQRCEQEESAAVKHDRSVEVLGLFLEFNRGFGGNLGRDRQCQRKAQYRFIARCMSR
ncbi:MAG: hypothetical protein F6J87_25285 [Spirulina sp. SIO3F2]|nr:hypothetical protein [Spirulina sp. SIO3F2]